MLFKGGNIPYNLLTSAQRWRNTVPDVETRISISCYMYYKFSFWTIWKHVFYLKFRYLLKRCIKIAMLVSIVSLTRSRVLGHKSSGCVCEDCLEQIRWEYPPWLWMALCHGLRFHMKLKEESISFSSASFLTSVSYFVLFPAKVINCMVIN